VYFRNFVENIVGELCRIRLFSTELRQSVSTKIDDKVGNDTTTNIRGSAKRNAAFTLPHGVMLTTRQPEGCVQVVVSRCAGFRRQRSSPVALPASCRQNAGVHGMEGSEFCNPRRHDKNHSNS
jgi:hypothetical protein